MENMEENRENIWKIRKKDKLKSEKIWKYGRKVGWIVKWFGKYGRKQGKNMKITEEK